MKIDFFIQQKIKTAYKESNRKRKFQTFDAIRSVLIIFNIEDWSLISDIITDLKDNNKHVIAWTIKPKLSRKELEYEPKINYPKEVRIIDTNTEISWFQNIIQTLPESIVEEYEKLAYDTLLDLTTASNPQLLYLLVKNNSSFSLGTQERDYKVSDFIILKEDDKNIRDTYDQMKFYLNKIRQNTNN